MVAPFNPSWPLYNLHVQTLLASTRSPAVRRALERSARSEVLPDSEGVSLQVRINQHPGAKGTALILPGWFGSSGSGYCMSLARCFLDAGWDTIRINPRDHGDTEHLNEGLYHAARLDEIRHLVIRLCRTVHPRPVHLIGFSLGGNFALRIALRQDPTAVPNLTGMTVISPVLDPEKASACVDAGPDWYRIYLMRKWKRSLLAKARAFPGRYDFTACLRHTRIIPLTETLIPAHSEFRSARDYFSAYTLTRDSFQSLAWPVTLIMAEDDPIIPYEDFKNLQGIHNLNMVITRRGGHCGFFSDFRTTAWSNRLALETAERLLLRIGGRS